jgi:D-alanine-D-alanine ligase
MKESSGARYEAMSAVGVVFGGPSPEHDVSILTGLQAARALTGAGRQVEAIYWTKGQQFVAVDAGLEAEAFVSGPPAGARELRFAAQPGGGWISGKGGLFGKEKPLELEAVVNCCHGGPGEDGTLQAALDLAGIAYTGPSSSGAALGMDKLAFGAVVAAAGLPALPRTLVIPGGPAPQWGGPYIVKPRFGGSSIGIEVIDDWANVVRLVQAGGVHTRRGMVAEPYRATAADVNVALRCYPSLQISLIEKPLRSAGGGAILGYQDKYLGGQGMVSAPRELPAQLGEGLDKQIRDAAAALADLAGVRGVARLDFLVEGEQWWVNEINTIPGSLAKYLWVGDARVDFATLLTDMVAEATRRPTARWDSTGADGLALRSASSIASKLG